MVSSIRQAERGALSESGHRSSAHEQLHWYLRLLDPGPSDALDCSAILREAISTVRYGASINHPSRARSKRSLGNGRFYPARQVGLDIVIRVAGFGIIDRRGQDFASLLEPQSSKRVGALMGGSAGIREKNSRIGSNTMIQRGNTPRRQAVRGLQN